MEAAPPTTVDAVITGELLQRSDVSSEEVVLAPQQAAITFMLLSAQLSYTDIP